MLSEIYDLPVQGERIKALKMVGREPSGILKGEWAGDKTLGETHPLFSKWRK